MRQYIRHPISMPVEIRTEPGSDLLARSAARDVSLGGLAVHSAAQVEPGRTIGIRITHVEPVFEASVRVVWCRASSNGGFELGVSFLDAQDAYLARMVEQLCYIEDYRRSVLRREGRQLDGEQAAAEWIERYAAEFPGSRGELH